jgi:rare lipoprotein A
MEKSQPHVASGTAGAEPPPEPEKQVANAPLASSPQVASLPLPAAAPAPAASSPPAQAPVTTEAGRVFLQLGAFGSRENADAFLARVKSQAEWLALQIFSRDGLHRVQAGPYASQTEARQAAERVVQALGIKSMVQTR